MSEVFAVIGMGYVGLPVALALASRFGDTIGYDIARDRMEELRRGFDRTGETDPGILSKSALRLTEDPQDLRDATFFVVTVPTPIDANRHPDLRALLAACESVGRALRTGTVVVFESTVYPGLTEEICGPTLERVSGLRCGSDFFLGYSPERINPGDRLRSLGDVVKVVAGQDEATLARIASVYEAIVPAGVHCAPSIRVAEAAKVIENTQRDLNIALMNELALIFERLGISTRDVLAAAGTKWNFLPFTPGLVGGHCIGVDPHYLTAKAEAVGYHPEVILAGRRINDGMGAFVARKAVKLLAHRALPVPGARVGILGLSFKENVRDLRNSRVPDIVRELAEFGVTARVHDPMVDPADALAEYGISLSSREELLELDCLIIAVAHDAFRRLGAERIASCVRSGGILMDVKSMLDPRSLPSDRLYWAL